MCEDKSLVRRLRRGDRAALCRIYEKYKDDLLTVAVWLGADLTVAEDCLHDTMVNLATKARNLRIRSSLKGYLIACAANRVRDQLRRNSRHVSPVDANEIAEFMADPAEDDSPLRQAIDREEAARLHQAMAKLPYDQREVIALHLSGQLKFREIARRQEVSINTARSRYRYGLAKLRNLLKGGHAHERQE